MWIGPMMSRTGGELPLGVGSMVLEETIGDLM